MNPAPHPPERRDAVRLLLIDSRTGSNRDLRLADLSTVLEPGDLMVVNDAATLPASLFGRLDGADVELRLLSSTSPTHWTAVLLGSGDWRTATEHRPAPALAARGDRIDLGDDLTAIVRAISPASPRLLDIELRSERNDVLERVYALGRPVQYAYLRDDLELWSVQTGYGSRPWAVEMPSAGRPLAWSLLFDLRQRGIEIAAITHAAGLSSTGDPAIDALLPLPERYEIPAETIDAIDRARATGGRVIAVGTTVVRALEGAAALHGGAPGPGSGTTDLRIDHHHRLRVVDGLLTGMHTPQESHFALLSAFAPVPVLLASWRHAAARGYLCHEFGDSTLLLRSSSS